MFRKQILYIGIFLFVACTALVIYLLRLSADEEKAYRELMTKADTTKDSLQNKPYKTKQHRQQIQKLILYNHEGSRCKVKLDCDLSDLELDHNESTTDIVEHLKNVKCYMQEELYYILEDGREVVQLSEGKFVLRSRPDQEVSEIEHLTPMQMIRYFEADKAIYSYRTNHLVAKKVHLLRFIVPGHEMITSIAGLQPLITGDADTAEFSLSGQNFHFKAHQLKATFHTLDDES